MVKMVNRCGFEQSTFSAGRCEEESKRMDAIVCPKPRHWSLINPQFSSGRALSLQMEISDSKTGAELFDIMLTKGGCREERSATQLASSPPFFNGSPPSRVSNPLIQDARFGSENVMVVPSPPPLSSPTPLSPSAVRSSGGCVRMKFGQQPAAVRIEGFDCLSRDRRNCSIFAMA